MHVGDVNNNNNKNHKKVLDEHERSENEDDEEEDRRSDHLHGEIHAGRIRYRITHTVVTYGILFTVAMKKYVMKSIQP